MEKAFLILGAFGTHGLERILSVVWLETCEIAIRYQMYQPLTFLGGFWPDPVPPIAQVGNRFNPG
jgi:uncharacterized membrane protein YgdD (TMEM256/DUF423 family)